MKAFVSIFGFGFGFGFRVDSSDSTLEANDRIMAYEVKMEDYGSKIGKMETYQINLKILPSLRIIYVETVIYYKLKKYL